MGLVGVNDLLLKGLDLAWEVTAERHSERIGSEGGGGQVSTTERTTGHVTDCSNMLGEVWMLLPVLSGCHRARGIGVVVR